LHLLGQPNTFSRFSLFRGFFEQRLESFTPLTLLEGASPAARAELRWLTEKMLGIAASADRSGDWGFGGSQVETVTLTEPGY
jgi:hypothetical protein